MITRFSRRRATRVLVALATLATMLALGNDWAGAVHDTGKFQLDGDAASATTPITSTGTDDWDKVCFEVTVTKDTTNSIPNECAGAGNTSGAAAVSWASDGPGSSTSDASVFAGGGSKDPEFLDDWRWKAGSSPDKDNLLHSFAARYSLPDSSTCDAGQETTCEVLFFGSDRFDNSGDAQQGFWFFQNPVSLSNTKANGAFKFNGEHRNGDVLVISNFSNGGTTSTISVYQWDDTVDGNLRLLESSDDANCALAGSNDGFCGIVNNAAEPALTDAPWSFTDKSGNSDYIDGELYEGGVNLSLLGLGDECFSSVLSETRSSTSTTAVLKDFVLGQFANCTATMTTQVSNTTVNPGTSVTDLATVVGSSAANTPTGTVTFYLCSFAVGSTSVCSTGGTSIGTGTLSGSGTTATATSPAVNTAAVPLTAGHYCFRAEWPGDSNYQMTTPLKHWQPNECFDVNDTASITTDQDWLPNDSATVTSAAGTALSGTLTFQLYTEGNCGATSGAAVSGQLYSHTLTSAASPATRSTSNGTYLVEADATVSWKVTFVPASNSGVTGTVTSCEVTTLDLTPNESA